MATVGQRIRQYRKSKDMTQGELAKKLSVAQATVSKWEADQDTPGGTRLQMLAGALDVDTADLLGFGAPDSLPGRRVRVIGALQAGAFEETIEFPYDDQYDVAVALDEDLAGLPVQGFEIRGDSMNLCYPEGSKVYVAPVRSLAGAPVSGDHVMVMRRQADGTVEGTVKEYVSDATGKWLWPRSNSPLHQAPVDYKKGGVESVEITGVVVAALVKRAVRVK